MTKDKPAYQASQKQRKASHSNTAEAKRKMWSAYSGSQKMKKYHEQRLSHEQSEQALRSGTWSDEQLAALRKSGVGG